MICEKKLLCAVSCKNANNRLVEANKTHKKIFHIYFYCFIEKPLKQVKWYFHFCTARKSTFEEKKETTLWFNLWFLGDKNLNQTLLSCWMPQVVKVFQDPKSPESLSRYVSQGAREKDLMAFFGDGCLN